MTQPKLIDLIYTMWRSSRFDKLRVLGLTIPLSRYRFALRVLEHHVRSLDDLDPEQVMAYLAAVRLCDPTFKLPSDLSVVMWKK